MSSGKQTSFANGEVSPSQQFKSQEATFSNSVSKLDNMYVRRDGGLSNRSGLKFIRKAISQQDIPEPGGLPGIKGFTFWNATSGEWETLEYARLVPADGWAADKGFGFVKTFSTGSGDMYPDPTTSNPGPLPGKVRFTSLKNDILISPEMDVTGENSAYNIPGRYLSRWGNGFYLNSGGVVIRTTGLAPWLPVSYLITVITSDGDELYVTSLNTVGYDPLTWDSNVTPIGANIAYPHVNCSNNIVLTLVGATPAYSKVFNLYRAAGAGGRYNSSFRLVGRQRFNGGGSVIFHDYGAEDPSQTPPLDDSMLGSTNLSGVEAAAYYQQRLICALKPGTTTSLKAGDGIASKIGAPGQIKSPVIYSDTGAFQFSVPVTDGTPIVAWLAMERLIAFTQKGTYVMRGGEQGILAPTTINPLKVSEEGCSSTVEPAMAGRRGYFINDTHTKLMAIEFGVDGNLSVFEASRLSSHLFQQKVLQIVALGGGEDTVFILRADGKLVRVTCAEDGVHGFATMETDGYIESIYQGKAKKLSIPNVTEGDDIYYDVLVCYVIRNGVRTKEQLVVREDRHREGEFFADGHIGLGWRLKYLNKNQGWVIVDEDDRPYGGPINLTTATDWLAGSIIKISMDTVSENPFEQAGVIHFHYIDEDGIGRVIRFTPSWGTVIEVPGTLTVEGTFEEEVPAYLQDVGGNGTISASEKMLRQTKWLPAFNRFPLIAYYGQVLVATTPLAVVMDGEVLSSPLNPNNPDIIYPVLSGGNWVIDLPDYYSWGYAGLPYTSEIQSMDLEAGDQRTFTDSKKLIDKLGIGVMETRGGFHGMVDRPLTDMEEMDVRSDDNYANQTQNLNGYVSVSIPTEYTIHGRVAVKNVDPVPMTILSMYPKGIAGD